MAALLPSSASGALAAVLARDPSPCLPASAAPLGPASSQSQLSGGKADFATSAANRTGSLQGAAFGIGGGIAIAGLIVRRALATRQSKHARQPRLLRAHSRQVLVSEPGSFSASQQPKADSGALFGSSAPSRGQEASRGRGYLELHAAGGGEVFFSRDKSSRRARGLQPRSPKTGGAVAAWPPPGRRPLPARASVEASQAGEGGRSYFQMGAHAHRIPFQMHARHRQKLADYLQAELGPEEQPGCAVLLEGGSELPVYDTDTVWDFKQESNFQWLFGVREPGCVGIVDVSTKRAILFVPRLPVEYEAWMGPRRTQEWFRDTYEVDEVYFTDEIAATLAKLGLSKLMVYNGVNRDSGLRLREPHFEGIEQSQLIRDSRLWDALAECRVVKDDDEIAIMQFVNDVSSDAHVAVMRGVRPNTPEYFAEADFKHYAFLRGCSRVGYSCICPAGSRCAVLHYGHAAFPNAEDVNENDMRLHDMGAEYHCYSADVTVSFPMTGRFTGEQRAVYEAVWDATLAVERALKPGVPFVEMHLLAERVLLQKMQEAGLFKQEASVAEMQEAGLMSHFMPHGLGHSLGLDVHDVGGFPPGINRDPRIQQNLRCGREVKAGMTVTVEPGFYFVDYLIAEALGDDKLFRYINVERLEQLRSVGGVRIEDDVLVTDKGCRVLTRVPRTVDEIEAVMAGGPWEARSQKFREYEAGS
eukprot:TRINITY_DN59727_c0_g2_i1.p1 TRINITY_DN59727_c0_g2~~TRINITY_DN59727_c0_g2_i1.p1  ORF type:complete len:723 (-),score=97.11 TRINITY_DN59727_c0_g2_i1:302-2401(-)